MNVEIEKKILCKVMERPRGVRKVIEQKYLVVTSKLELRVRSVNRKIFTITLKYGSGWIRKEWERTIPSWLYSVLSLVAPWSVHKIRYCDGPWDIDLYKGLKRLAVAEIELTDPSEKIPYIPHWILAVSNITNKPEWKNKNIALNGLPHRKAEFE